MKARRIATTVMFLCVLGLIATCYSCWPRHHFTSPKHFLFDYPFQPSPGKRYWTAVGQTWIEQYESGEYNRFRVVNHTTINTMTGTVAVKTSGGSDKTVTGNEGYFQVFIPDAGNKKMALWFRRKVDNTWQAWQSLPEMENIE